MLVALMRLSPPATVKPLKDGPSPWGANKMQEARQAPRRAPQRQAKRRRARGKHRLWRRRGRLPLTRPNHRLPLVVGGPRGVGIRARWT